MPINKAPYGSAVGESVRIALTDGEKVYNSKIKLEVSVKQFGAVGDGVKDDSAAFQSAVNTIAAGEKRAVVVPAGTYLIGTNVTISGKVVVWHLFPGATITGAGTLPGVVDLSMFRDNILIRYASEILEADTNEQSFAIQAEIPSTSSTSAYQKDAFRASVLTKDDSDAAGVNLDAVAITGVGTISVSNAGGRCWAMNALAQKNNGGGGELYGLEINVEDKSTTSAPPKEISQQNEQIALKITSKDGKATAAIDIISDNGEGFYKVLIAPQGAIISDAASRFIELTDLFEVDRDGSVYVGKGSSASFTQGVEIDPAGEIIITDEDSQAILRLIVTETGASAARVIADISAQQKDSAGNDEQFVRIRMRSSGITSGAEEGVYELSVNGAGTLYNAITATGANTVNPLSIRVNSALKGVTEGATDSGGSGFKALRVPN